MFLLKLRDEAGEPLIHTLVVGSARPSDFDEHMKSIGQYEATMADGTVVDAIATKLRGMYKEACGEEWVEGWWRGLPDPFGNIDGEGELVCVANNPNAVHFGAIVWQWSICHAWDFHEFARQRYGARW
jgi:hypothetical protein